MLVPFVKSIRAYNVKSSNTLFSDKIQWNFRISFWCARFIRWFDDNLIIESWDYGKQDFWDPCVIKLKNLAFMCDTLIWKICISAYIECFTYLDWRENLYFNSQTFRTFVQVEINKVLHDSFVEDRHLVARYENNRAGGSRFERVGSQNFFRNRQISLETSATCSILF